MFRFPEAPVLHDETSWSAWGMRRRRPARPPPPRAPPSRAGREGPERGGLPEWMKPIYNFLGLDVGLIYSNQEYSDKINAYKKDITYGTNNEFAI